jgi:hypothetical protein
VTRHLDDVPAADSKEPTAATIDTQPVPRHIGAAVQALRAVVDHDAAAAARAGLAVAVLTDTQPPYLLPAAPAQHLSAAQGVDAALEQLRHALEEATSAEEAVRIAVARRELLGDPIAPAW